MPRRRRQPRGPTILVVSLIASAAIHVVIGFPVKSFVETYLAGASDAEPPVKVVRLSNAQWSKNLRTNQPRRRANVPAQTDPNRQPPVAESAADKLAREAEKKKKEPVKPDRQVVKVAPTADDTPNPDAKFLSKQNTNVKKESVARLEDRDPRAKRVTNKLQTAKDPEPAVKNAIRTRGLTLKGDGLKKDLEGKAGQDKFDLKLPDVARRDKLKLGLGIDDDALAMANRSASEGMIGNSDRFELNLGSLGGDKGEAGGKKGPKNGAKEPPPLPTLSALVPMVGRAGRLSGSPSMDHIEGLPEGEGTFLNTKEFKYATFITRVSDSVYPYWDSFLHTEYRRRDPTRRIYGQRDRATVVRVELDLDGQVKALHVAESSGVGFLDDVIVKAINKAQPFPNPPEAMADEDGVIRLSYRFVVVMRPRGGLFRGLR